MSYDYNAAGSSSFFGDYQNMSDFKFDDIYSLESDNDWLSSIWDYTKGFANSQVGSGLIQGAAGAALSMYNQNEQQEALDKRFDQTREDTNAWREEQLAFQREQLAAQMGMQQAILDDKINTRRRHNESINTKPNNAKKIKFG